MDMGYSGDYLAALTKVQINEKTSGSKTNAV